MASSSQKVVELPNEKRRDRQAEERRAQLNLFHRVQDVREARENGDLKTLWQVAQSLILCGLPYDEVPDTRWARRARLADGSTLKVTFVATEDGVPLPFGQDRGPLYFLIHRSLENYRKLEAQLDRNPDYVIHDGLDPEERERRLQQRHAILDQARFVEWETATQYLDVMDKTKGGKAYAILRDRLRRLRSCAISVVRLSPNGVEESLVLPIVRASRIPGWAKAPTSAPPENNEPSSCAVNLHLTPTNDDRPVGFEMGRDFFHDFVRYHVPVPELLIKKFLRTPKRLDLLLWFSWRVYAAQADTFIPLSELRQQLGTTDTNDGRLLDDLRSVIKAAVQFGWKELRAEVLAPKTRAKTNALKGLRIGPPKNNVYLVPSNAKNMKRVKTTEDGGER